MLEPLPDECVRVLNCLLPSAEEGGYLLTVDDSPEGFFAVFVRRMHTNRYIATVNDNGDSNEVTFIKCGEAWHPVMREHRNTKYIAVDIDFNGNITGFRSPEYMKLLEYAKEMLFCIRSRVAGK